MSGARVRRCASGAAVGDAGLKELASLSALEVVLSAGSQVTAERQAALRARRPGISFEERT